MQFLTRFLFASGLAVVLAGSASAQQQGGGGQGGGGQGGGGQGGQGGGQNGQTAGLPFGSGGNVGLETQQMQTVTNSVTNAQTNVLGGYYANPFFQGRIGTFGGQSPGGFGQALSNATGSSGGRSGAVNTGFGSTGGGRGGGAGAMTSTGGFGGTGGATQGFSGGASGFGGAATGGARTGQTGFGGGQAGGFGGGQTGGFGGGQAGLGGRQAGGLGGGLGGRQGGQFGGRGGMGATNPNAIAGDRPINVLFTAAGTGSIGAPSVSPPLATRAQTDLRGQFDRTMMISAGKSIDVQVNGDGIARLRGTVATNDEKRLAIGLAQLTPGVRRVVSELTVSPAP